MSTTTDARAYPDRPYLAVSAAIIRDGHVLIVRRARPPAHGLFTLPGGVVEVGETLAEAVVREVREETGILVEPVALAGHREVVARDADNRIQGAFLQCLRTMSSVSYFEEGALVTHSEWHLVDQQ